MATSLPDARAFVAADIAIGGGVMVGIYIELNIHKKKPGTFNSLVEIAVNIFN